MSQLLEAACDSVMSLHLGGVHTVLLFCCCLLVVAAADATQQTFPCSASLTAHVKTQSQSIRGAGMLLRTEVRTSGKVFRRRASTQSLCSRLTTFGSLQMIASESF